MDYWFIAYIVLCICVGGGLVAQLYNRQQTIGAMVLLVLCIAIFSFFGLRWFQGGELKGSKPAAQQWPPIVNLCPDFMVATKGTDGNTYCYDPTNTYPLTTDTKLVTFTPAGKTTSVTGLKIYDAAAKANPLKTPTTTAAKSIVDISSTTANQKMRWEGVWDGRNFNTGMIPTATS